MGERIGHRGYRVDKFGDNLMADILPGDDLRTRHDTVKITLQSFCLASKLPAECEVHGLFSDLIPQEAREVEGELQYGRGRQALLPDFKVDLPSSSGGTEPTLAELKVIGAVKSWYPRGSREKGVERRAKCLTGEYMRPLAKLDSRYHNTPRGETGPLVKRLQSFGRLQGLVVGAWGEGSKDLHSLLDILASYRLRAVGLARGREGSDAERGVILAQFRRVLSTSAIRSQTKALVARLQVMGEKGRDAARRRALVGKENRRLEEEMRGHWQAHIRALGVSRSRGNFFVPN